MKTMLFALSLFLGLQTLVNAEEVYRPYAFCEAPHHKVKVEIMQNRDEKNALKPFVFTVNRDFRGNKISHQNLSAHRIPVRHRDVLEMFQSHVPHLGYGFDLVVSSQMMMSGSGYRAIFTDSYTSSVVYCYYYIAFN